MDIRDAIERQKQIKSWRRKKKVALIESLNPKWRDLSRDSQLDDHQHEDESLRVESLRYAAKNAAPVEMTGKARKVLRPGGRLMTNPVQEETRTLCQFELLP